jgi:hypothetical protein
MGKTKALGLIIIFISACLIFSNPISAISTENTWVRRTPFPNEVGIVGAAVVGAKIYVMGGSTNFEYNPVTDSWTNKTAMPTPRWHFGITVYQNTIYTMGGWDSSDVANEAYNPASDTWKIMKSMPRNVSEGDCKITARVVDGKIYAMGFNSNYIYDIASDSWSIGKAMPFPSSFSISSAVYNNKIYCIGGNKTQIYDPKTDSWSLGASLPNPVSNPAVCSTTGTFSLRKIYVFGGETSFLEYTDKTQVYNPENNSWTLGSSMPTPRGNPTVAVINDQIYVIGGGLYWGRSETTNELYTPFGYGKADLTPTPSVTPNPSVPEFPSLTIPLLLTIILASAGLVVYHKTHKKDLVKTQHMKQLVSVPLLEHNVP